MQSCTAHSRRTCFVSVVGLDNLQRSLPTPIILWFCDSVILWFCDSVILRFCDSVILWNDATFNHIFGVRIPQHVQEVRPQHAGLPGEVGMVAFGGYHEAVQGTVMLGCLLHVFWCWHWAKRVPGHFSGFNCTLIFSPRPCHPQDVFPCPLIRLTSCSCSQDADSLGCSSDVGLSGLHIYPLDSCLFRASGFYLAWLTGAPIFCFLWKGPF